MTINNFELSGILQTILKRKDRYGEEYFVLNIKSEVQKNAISFFQNFSILIFGPELKELLGNDDLLNTTLYISGTMSNMKDQEGKKRIALIGKRILKR